MGEAISIGLSLSDFFILTPSEFFGIWEHRNKQMQDTRYDSWNKMRYHACITLQPHLSKGATLTPQKLLPLDGDKDNKSQHTETMTKEQRKACLAKRLQQINESSVHNNNTTNDNGK